MTHLHMLFHAAPPAMLALGGCATRPVDPSITQAESAAACVYDIARQVVYRSKETA